MSRKSIQAQVADQRTLYAQRANAFKIVDDLHRESFAKVLVEDFSMDNSQWVRVLLPLRGTSLELSHSDFEVLFDIANHHGAKLSIQNGYVVIWPETS